MKWTKVDQQAFAHFQQTLEFLKCLILGHFRGYAEPDYKERKETVLEKEDPEDWQPGYSPRIGAHFVTSRIAINMPSLCYARTSFPGQSHLASAEVCSQWWQARSHTARQSLPHSWVRTPSRRVEVRSQPSICSVLRCQLLTTKCPMTRGKDEYFR